MPVGKFCLVPGEAADAVGVQGGDLRHHLAHFSAIGPGVHAHRAAQASGDAVGKFQPGQARLLGVHRQAAEQDAGVGLQGHVVQAADARHAFRRFDDQGVQPPVRHQQIGAPAQQKRPDAALLRQAQQDHQLLPALRKGHAPGGAADAEGGVAAHGHVPLHRHIRQVIPDLFVQTFIPLHSDLPYIRFFFPSRAAPMIPA